MQPLRRLRVVGAAVAALEPWSRYIAEETNVRRVEFDEQSVTRITRPRGVPDYRALASRLGTRTTIVAAAIKGLTEDQLKAYGEGHPTCAAGHRLQKGDLVVDRVRRTECGECAEYEWDGGLAVWLDVHEDRQLMTARVARETIGAVQRLRKQMRLDFTTRIRVHYEQLPGPGDLCMAEAVATHAALFEGAIGTVPTPDCPAAGQPGGLCDVVHSGFGVSLRLVLTRA